MLVGVSSSLGQQLFLGERIVCTKAIRQAEVYSKNGKKADVAEVEKMEG